jgi:hypothetical protein
MVACGDWFDREPEVAAPAVSLNRSAVPLGAPIELTFRFDVLATTPALAEDYRVMVHFLDANGELMWTDDHDPPKPTRQWQPGQTVTYTRRVFVPMYPYVGEAAVVVGLYSASSGDRLRLAGNHLGQHSYQVATLRLEPQAESSFLVFEDGWYPAEFSTGDASVEWQWTGPEASISFRNSREDSILYLQLDGRPDLFEAPQQVALVINDRIIQSFPVTASEPTFHELALSASDLGDADKVSVRLRVDKTFVPARLPGHDRSDQRVLGIRVYYAFLEPRPQR